MAWPPEFRTDVDGDGKGDIDGEPIVISDEDVICIHHVRWNVRDQIGSLDRNEFFEGYGPPFPVQFEERILSFDYPVARDIQFHQVTCRNMSRWHFYAWNGDPSRGPVTPPDVPYLLPTDINHMMIGQYATCTGSSGGWDGPSYIGYNPSLRLLFGFDRDFVSAGYSGQVGFMGMVFLHTPEVNGEEIPMTVATTPSAGGENRPWTLWSADRMKTENAWNMIRGQLYLERQSPGPNPGNVADPRTDSNVYISSWEDRIFKGMAQSDELILPPDSAVQFDFAWLCAYPVNNPVPDNSDEGVAVEAGNLVNLASAAYEIYDNGFIHPGTPVPPNISLVPGDCQVTITWDDISESSRDEMFDYYGGTNDYREYDFQGYRVYRSTTGRAADAELLAEFDLATGLQYSFTVTGLENCFPYYYVVTAYDWNALDTNDPSTVFSRECPVIFGPGNRVIPTSNPDSYRRPLISDETTDLVMFDGSGDSLSIVFRDIQVEDYWLADGAITTNALSHPYIFMQDAGQTYGTYYIVVDSIVGEPDETENPATIEDYDYKLMNRVYVSLTDKLGRVIISDSKMIKCAWAAYPGHGAHFFLHPSKDDVGVPFNIEFEIPPYSVDLMIWNDVEIQNGATPLENIDLLQGYNGGSNSVPLGYRAADIELRWHEVGDSLTLEVRDLTHNVEIPYNRLPGSSWSFYKSWIRFLRLSSKLRIELTESDFSGAGPNRKAPKTPSRAGSDVKFYLFVCGLQLKVSTPETTVPRQGDVWLIRTNYGNYPEGGTGLLTQVDYYGDPLIRPPVTGVRYMVSTGGTGEAPTKSCDFSGDGKILINDVITFLLMARDDPNDPRVDWNEDGVYLINDAIVLLMDIMNGTCPDAAVLLAADKGLVPVPMVHSLSAEDIEYIERMMAQMNLNQEQEAALRLVLYGKTGAASLPRVFSLSQNAPNPFNPSTAICYTVPESRTVKVVLKVYDIRGALVRTLVDEVKEAGRYFVFWDGTDNKGSRISSGVYFYRIQAGDFVQTRKMVLLK